MSPVDRPPEGSEEVSDESRTAILRMLRIVLTRRVRYFSKFLEQHNMPPAARELMLESLEIDRSQLAEVETGEIPAELDV